MDGAFGIVFLKVIATSKVTWVFSYVDLLFF